jgi:DNA-binding NarL/FixJ family response regulator
VEEVLDAALADMLAMSILAPMPPSRASRLELTSREREVLELIVAGRSNAEIADALFISPKTASVHVANIKGKLGADSRVGIVTTALQRRLVVVPGPS